ncbi:MAG TPA: 30S ribosomal protein S17 [Patescibacteria group bacterium]|nr:30S ribosomal protein S17 [Patescibacteria group bacterium]
MAKKTFIGKVVSNKMTKTVVVEIERTVKHPIYKKLIRKTGRVKADTNNIEVSMNEMVKIEQARPMSKGKNFKVIEIIKEKGAKS